jgi:hypothetical protein
MIYRQLRSWDAVRLYPGVDHFLNAGCDAISFVSPAFKETERVFDGIVGQRQVQPASLPRAQRGRRDPDGSREARDPLVAVKGATGLLQEVGGCVSCRFHNTTGSYWAGADNPYFVGGGGACPMVVGGELVAVS